MSISTRLKTLLGENHIPYAAMTHATAYTAHGASATMKISGKELAKTVVLRAGEDTVLAVLPARTMQVWRKQAACWESRHGRRPTRNSARYFQICELGAMPPFGELYGLPIYVDESLAADEEIVFNAGTHHDAIRLLDEDFARLAKPVVCAFATKG